MYMLDNITHPLMDTIYIQTYLVLFWYTIDKNITCLTTQKNYKHNESPKPTVIVGMKLLSSHQVNAVDSINIRP